MSEDPMVPSETEPSHSDAGAHTPTQIRSAESNHKLREADAKTTTTEPDDVDPEVAQPEATQHESVESVEAVERKPEESTQAGAAESADFAQMVREHGEPKDEVKVGDRVRGKIVSIAEDFTFVDYSGRAEARIATAELRDKQQHVALRVGDALSATVSSVEDGVVLTLGRRRGVVHAARLRDAFENKVPVQGAVKAVNKGGFDVQIGGIRTFCPLSQIDRNYVEDPQAYVGKSYSFRVLRWENGGRNIVVTRRALLEEHAAEKAVETRKKLAVDATLEGTVTRIQPFGAFVDLGGLEGLLHVSRMGHGRVDDPKSVVQPGQKLSVRVLSIENEGSKKERISLALTNLGPDPWEVLVQQHAEGDILSGTVARLTDFGAFIRLENGVDGLVHISEISDQRIQHPKEVLQVGASVEVRILRIESDKKRVSLSLRRPSDEAPAPRPRREPRSPRRNESPAPSNGPLTHTMADQLGALKKKLRNQ